MKNKIEDLRNHLFMQLERLNDDDCDLEKEVEKAKAITGVAQVLVSSAKVEVDFLKAIGGCSSGSGFIPEEKRITPTK